VHRQAYAGNWLQTAGALRANPPHAHVLSMTAMVRFHTHMAPEDHGALQKLAHEQGVSAAELLRRAIRRELAEHAAWITRTTDQPMEANRALP
jgi:hypothetical protein